MSFLIGSSVALPFAIGQQSWTSIAGTFGRVLECWDREAREYVAIKVVRSLRKYRHAAMIEIDVLNSLSKHDSEGSRYVLSIFDLLIPFFTITGLYTTIFLYFILTQLCPDSKVV